MTPPQKSILVADDDAAIVDALTMILDLENYKVDTVLDGKVIQQIHKHPPDLLLLDIWMTGADGKEICKQLKSDNKTKDIPVILISASRDLKKSAETAGADGYIEKPFDMHVLLDTVRSFVHKS